MIAETWKIYKADAQRHVNMMHHLHKILEVVATYPKQIHPGEI